METVIIRVFPESATQQNRQTVSVVAVAAKNLNRRGKTFCLLGWSRKAFTKKRLAGASGNRTHLPRFWQGTPDLKSEGDTRAPVAPVLDFTGFSLFSSNTPFSGSTT